MPTAIYTHVIILACATVDIMLVSREICREMHVNSAHDLYTHQQPKRPACVHTTRVSSRACELMYAVWHNTTPLQLRLPRQSELTDELSFERTPNEPKRPACVHTTRVSSRACGLMCAVWHNATSRQPRLPRQSELIGELSCERTPNEHIYNTNEPEAHNQ